MYVNPTNWSDFFIKKYLISFIKKGTTNAVSLFFTSFDLSYELLESRLITLFTEN